MGRKKLMLLGGIRYLLPVIAAAHEQGYYVITADYLPDNIAHRYSDKYANVSIIDKEAVLAAARAENIDGIMSFGVDPGVVAASYVQEKMGLPSFGPFRSVEILQNKDRFRKFLSDNGFNVPRARGFSSVEEALEDLSWYEFPVIVKPTDSAGSKGCSRVDGPDALRPALEEAMRHSVSGHVIVEEFIEKEGCSSDTDSMSVDGKLAFVSFCAQRFDAEASNPYTPAAYSWPSTFTEDQEAFLSREIQRLISLLDLKTAVYNIETRVGVNGKPYIMELTPRGGGNRLCEMLRYATGVDLITAVVRYCVGDPLLESVDQKPYQGHWAEIILHASRSGRFGRLEINPVPGMEIVERDLWVDPGDPVDSFDGANNAIGTLVLKFDTSDSLEYAITHQRDWLRIVVE